MSMVDSGVRRNLVERVKRICLSPDSEWSVIDHESASTSTLLTEHVVPLATVSAVAAFIGRSIIGFTLPFVGTTYRVPIVNGLVSALLQIALTAVAIVVCGMIIDALAPTFGAQKNSMQAMKVAAYAPTPGWVVGVVQVFPVLGALGILGAIYSLYLLYLGLPKLMKCPKEKALGYTVAAVLCFIVMGIVIGAVSSMFIASPLNTTLVQ